MKKIFSLILPLFLVVSLTSCNSGFGVWIRSITNNQTIKTSENKEILPFENVFYIDYYITKDVTDQNKIRDILTRNLNFIYPFIDTENNYLDDNSNLINNLKVINESFNFEDEIIIDETLFNLLKIAKNYSISNKSYSMFSYNLTKWWDYQIKSSLESDLNSSDPLFNENTKKELETIVTCIPHSEEEINEMLELNEETLGVKFNIKEECSGELFRPLIDLKDVSVAYLVDLIRVDLLENGYNQGLIYADGKMVYTLGEAIDKWSFALRDPRHTPNKDIKTIANVITNRKFAAFTLDDFPLNRNYVIENDNEVIRRHEKINALTGYPSNTVRSIVGVTYEKSALELYFYTLDLFNKNSVSEINNSLISDFEIIYVSQESEKLKVYSTSKFDNKLSVKKDIDLIILE